MDSDNRKIKRGKTVIKPPKKQQPQLSRDEVRKINKQKRIRKKKIRKFLLTVAAVIVAVVTCAVLMVAFLFNVKTITVEGESQYPDSMIIEKSGIAEGDALYLINTDEVEKNIEEALPYTKNVEIKQKFPNSVIINVEASKEFAAIASGTGYILIDEDCKVLNKNATLLSESIVLVSGVSVKSAEEGSELQISKAEKFETLSAVLGAVEESGIERISEVNLKNTKDIKVIYDNRITLNVGSVEDVVRKMSRAKAVVKAEDENNSHATGEVDLTNGQRIIFTATEETTESVKKPAQKDKTKTETTSKAEN